MTTNDTDVLIEKALWGLTRVYDAPHGGTETGVHAPVHQVVTAVLPIVEAEVRAAKAEGWDDCAHEADRRWLIGGQSAAILHDCNPHRETGDNYEQR